MAAISLFGDTNMAAVTSCEFCSVPFGAENSPREKIGEPVVAVASHNPVWRVV